ncbi:MAG: hypothetical protein KDA80_15880 [Planctomycetaceae bacterium]|nr:hypothetical protein [Planctomycetaceae bacterium]
MKIVFGMVLGVLIAAPTVGQDNVAEMAQRLPDDVNTIGIVRIGEVLGSPLATREGWHDQLEERFLAGAAGIPPHIPNLVVGSLIHPTVPEEVWSTMIIPLPPDMSMETIAERSEASVELLGDQKSVRTRRNAFVSEIGDGLVAVYSPAHRQDAARWIRAITNRRTGQFSEYLASAVKHSGHLVLALDLAEMIDPTQLKRLLSEDPRFRSQKALVEKVVPLLSGARGLTLVANVKDAIECEITIDFQSDVGTSAFTVKSLFLSALEDLGASIDEFAGASPKAQGNAVVMSCELSDSSFRRLLTLVSLPPSSAVEVPSVADMVVTEPKAPPRVDPEKDTREYVEAVNKMIDDLEKAARKGTNYERTAMWHEKFADKIDSLSLSGVSQDARKYGAEVSNAFRALASSLRGQGIEVNAAQGTLVYNTQYTPGWASMNIWGGVGYGYGSYNVTSNLQEVREKQAAAVVAGAKDREEVWRYIRDQRAEMMRQLQ